MYGILTVFLEALERESLELKKRNVLHWDVGLKLSVQLYFLLNRSKLQYPYFEIIPFYDNLKLGIINEGENKNENENENERANKKHENVCYSKSDGINQSTTKEITLIEEDRDSICKNRNEDENDNDNENENENENEKIILNRISHSYFPFISLRGHSWRRVIIALQHLKTPKHEIQNIVSVQFLTKI